MPLAAFSEKRKTENFMKQNLLVLFGGQSSEHDVSCMSAVNVIKNVDTERYQLILTGITKEGHWVYTESLESIEDGSWRESKVSAILSPDASVKGMYLMEEDMVKFLPVDVIFPVLHGLYGEDGTVQGIFELAKIPYVGCGVLASAVSMDKVYTKIVVDQLGIRQAEYVVIHRNELEKISEAADRVEAKLSYPVFVKPSCAGSSVGVGTADNRGELISALLEAGKHDSKILVEDRNYGRELECAVFGTDREVKASGIGEILAAADFYDFDAKYHNAESKTVVDPELPAGIAEEIRENARKIFSAVGGFSLSRVDFFLDKKGVVFNEINTLPGFTAISMYPMLWENMGIEKKELIQRLIDTAFVRQEH